MMDGDRNSPESFITSPLLNRLPFLLHAFGTRHFPEEHLKFREPWKWLQPVSLRQKHSDLIQVLSQKPLSPLPGDALITAQPGLLLIIKTADCLPVLIADSRRRVIAAAHCGWRGTASRLLSKVIARLASEFDSRPEDLHAAFGPCIKPECYEVGEDVREVFGRAGFSLDEDLFRKHPGKQGFYFLDLKLANRRQLLEAGFRPENIDDVEICPHCRPDFTSWRRDREGAGRLLNLIAMKQSF